MSWVSPDLWHGSIQGSGTVCLYIGALESLGFAALSSEYLGPMTTFRQYQACWHV